MMFRMIEQLWNTNTLAIVSPDPDLTEIYMYFSMKFRYFAGKLMFLIVLASNQLAVIIGSMFSLYYVTVNNISVIHAY